MKVSLCYFSGSSSMIPSPETMRSSSVIRLCIAMFLMIMLLAGQVQARSLGMESLGAVQVEVENREQAERLRAFGAAMRLLVVRLTGDSDMARDSRVTGWLSQAPQYVRQYRYEEDTNGRLTLVVQFDAVETERQLLSMGLPIWQADRPDLLLWLAVQGDGERRLVGAQEDYKPLAHVFELANLRGIPLLLPILDLEDQAGVRVTDVLAGFTEGPLQASARYQPDGVVLASLQPRGNAWAARIQLLMEGVERRWENQSSLPEQALGEAFLQMSDALGRQFARSGVGPGQDAIQVRVQGLRNFDDYVRVRNHLASLPPVMSVQARDLMGDGAQFLVQLRTDASDFERAVRQGAMLAPLDAPESRSEGPAFRLLR